MSEKNSRCECGNLATVRRFNHWICARCDKAQNDGCVGGPNKRRIPIERPKQPKSNSGNA
jgi:hypothetical protein